MDFSLGNVQQVKEEVVKISETTQVHEVLKELADADEGGDPQSSIRHEAHIGGTVRDKDIIEGGAAPDVGIVNALGQEEAKANDEYECQQVEGPLKYYGPEASEDIIIVNVRKEVVQILYVGPTP